MKKTFQGKFKTFFELENSDLGQASSYNLDKISTAFSQEKWLIRQSEFFEMSLNGELPRNSNLPIFTFLNSRERILDIGGGSGWVSNLLHKDCVYRNLENKDIQEFFSNRYNISSRFISDASEIITYKPSMVYANSVVQYFTKIADFINLVVIAQPLHVLLDDLYLSERGSFYSLQRYYETYIPTFFPFAEEFISMFKEISYDVVFDFPFLITNNKDLRIAIDLHDEESEFLEPPRTILFRKNH